MCRNLRKILFVLLIIIYSINYTESVDGDKKKQREKKKAKEGTQSQTDEDATEKEAKIHILDSSFGTEIRELPSTGQPTVSAVTSGLAKISIDPERGAEQSRQRQEQPRSSAMLENILRHSQQQQHLGGLTPAEMEYFAQRKRIQQQEKQQRKKLSSAQLEHILNQPERQSGLSQLPEEELSWAQMRNLLEGDHIEPKQGGIERGLPSTQPHLFEHQPKGGPKQLSSKDLQSLLESRKPPHVDELQHILEQGYPRETHGISSRMLDQIVEQGQQPRESHGISSGMLDQIVEQGQQPRETHGISSGMLDDIVKQGQQPRESHGISSGMLDQIVKQGQQPRETHGISSRMLDQIVHQGQQPRESHGISSGMLDQIVEQGQKPRESHGISSGMLDQIVEQGQKPRESHGISSGMLDQIVEQGQKPRESHGISSGMLDQIVEQGQKPRETHGISSGMLDQILEQGQHPEQFAIQKPPMNITPGMKKFVKKHYDDTKKEKDRITSGALDQILHQGQHPQQVIQNPQMNITPGMKKFVEKHYDDAKKGKDKVSSGTLEQILQQGQQLRESHGISSGALDQILQQGQHPQQFTVPYPPMNITPGMKKFVKKHYDDAKKENQQFPAPFSPLMRGYEDNFNFGNLPETPPMSRNSFEKLQQLISQLPPRTPQSRLNVEAQKEDEEPAQKQLSSAALKRLLISQEKKPINVDSDDENSFASSAGSVSSVRRISSQEFEAISTRAGRQQGQQQNMLMELYQTQLSSDDLTELRDGRWVGNAVFDAYLRVITDGWPTLGFVPTYVIASYRANMRIPGANRFPEGWPQNTPVEGVQFWFIPVFLERRFIDGEGQEVVADHWAMAVFDVRTNTIAIYDSMSPGGEEQDKIDFLSDLEAFFNEFYRIRGALVENPRINLISMTDLPTQRNGNDCGVFALTYAYCVARQERLDAIFNFGQDQMNEFRIAIYNNILMRMKRFGLFPELNVQRWNAPAPAAQFQTGEGTSSVDLENLLAQIAKEHPASSDSSGGKTKKRLEHEKSNKLDEEKEKKRQKPAGTSKSVSSKQLEELIDKKGKKISSKDLQLVVEENQSEKEMEEKSSKSSDSNKKKEISSSQLEKLAKPSDQKKKKEISSAQLEKLAKPSDQKKKKEISSAQLEKLAKPSDPKISSAQLEKLTKPSDPTEKKEISSAQLENVLENISKEHGSGSVKHISSQLLPKIVYKGQKLSTQQLEILAETAIQSGQIEKNQKPVKQEIEYEGYIYHHDRTRKGKDRLFRSYYRCRDRLGKCPGRIISYAGVKRPSGTHNPGCSGKIDQPESATESPPKEGE